jgi:uncharacterized protein (DUF952 family)
MSLIFHITLRSAWEAAQAAGEYRGDTLETDGFIHCSLAEQVVPVANAYYRGQTGMVLLCIDAERTRAEVRYEDCCRSGQAYPHVYGPLNLDAVVLAVDFPPQADGTFVLPEDRSGAAGFFSPLE